jgi:hypothetical protein
VSEQGYATTTNGLAVREDALTVVPFEQDTLRLAKAMAASGFFKDSPDVAKAAVKILAGKELGVGPVAAMTGIYIVEGKVVLSANLMAAVIKRSGRYTYRVRTLTNEACAIEFFEGTAKKESIGVSEFTMEDARAAKLADKDTWKKYARNLLFARAMSNGARFFCADVFGGPTYTPEELGANVDEDGTPVEVAPQEGGSKRSSTPTIPAETRAAGPSPVQEPAEGDFTEEPTPIPPPRNPSRTAVDLATPAQVRAIYLIARDQHGLSEEVIDDRSRQMYGTYPAELTKRQATTFISALKGGEPEEPPPGTKISDHAGAFAREYADVLDDQEGAAASGEATQATPAAITPPPPTESPAMAACHSLYARMQKFSAFERVPFPHPNTDLSAWHDGWLSKVEEAERAAERRAQTATQRGR